MALTKFTNSVTVLDEAVCNALYGGLFGSPEGALLPANDPLVAGHVHDGLHDDGHAQKIDLANHVTGLLPGAMIADGSITLAKLDPTINFGKGLEYAVLTTDGRFIFDASGNIIILSSI